MNFHSGSEYHTNSLTRMSEFVKRYENPSQTIATQLNTQLQKIMENSRKVIESLLRVVMLCRKQGLALRGHRDDNIVWTNEEESEPDNHGNFIELVCFRAESDEVLRHHLQSAPRNAMYTSKTIQNELINITGSRIQSDILREIKQAKFYTVIADEVSDVSNKEQLSIAIRYVLNGIVHESFIDFAEVERITGQALASSILHCVKAWGLSLSNMRGQCYDGTSNMSGAVAGCRSLVQQEAPMAIYFHCASHRLNLAIVSACSVQAYKNTEACIGEMARFFSYSAKRQRLLDKAMDSLSSPPNAKKLKDACRTRWIQRIDCFLGGSPSCSRDSPSYVIPTPVCELRYRLEVGYRYRYQSQQLPLPVRVFFFLGMLQDPSRSASKSSRSHCKAAATCT